MVRLPRTFKAAALSVFTASLSFAANEINRYRAELDSPLSEADIAAITTHERWPNKLSVQLKPAAGPDAFASLEKLPDLRKLYFLEYNQKISDLAPLASLPRLESLHVRILEKAEKNPVSISPLTHCPDLVEVDFYGTPVTDVGTLASCTKLQKLSLYMSAVDSIDFLAATPNITDLSLYGSHTFPNYEPVAKLTKLRKLDIYMNKQATDANLSALKPLTSLRIIHMAGCRDVSSLDFLLNCTELEELRADWCDKLADIKVLARMPKLTRIELWRAPLTDITLLSGKADLLTLNLAETKISDLSPLQSSTKLKELILSETLVKDLSPLSGMTSLETLELKKTLVTDLKPLAGLPELDTLDLEGAAVTDLAPLHKLPKLRRLTLPKTTPASQIEALKVAFPDLQVRLK
jgi:Leucine-rich repeat (LRR) protein